MSNEENTQRERPILFSGEMVRAILRGEKTQTRRVVRFRHPKELCDLPIVEYARDGMPIWWDSPPPQNIRDSDYYDQGKPCPYGQPGDRLWVRETWCLLDRHGWSDPSKPRDALINYGSTHCPRRNACAYRASCDSESERCRIELGYKWTPSIHMPRWASRLTLEITDIRVQRLQDISKEDAQAEGVDAIPSAPAALSHRTSFAKLWDKLNAKRGFGYEKNPWTWCISFRRVNHV